MLGRPVIDLSLHRIHSLLEQLGSPQVALLYRNVRLIHVTGTNGKGSTVEMIANGLMAEPRAKVATFTSPFVQMERDSIRIFQKARQPECIPEETWDDIREQISALLIDMSAEEVPTDFEVLFATALMYFSSIIDLTHLVVEVGMGGRLDATNVFESVVRSCDISSEDSFERQNLKSRPSSPKPLPPTVCVITSISLDHQKYLGTTVESICREKCGIFTPGCVVIVNGHIPQSCRAVVDDMFCRVGGSKLVTVDDDWMGEEMRTGQNSSDPPVETPLTPPLNGAHQLQLMKVAIEAVMAVASKTDNGNEDYIKKVIEEIYRTKLPGRMEFRSDNGKVPLLLDGAHNPESASALRTFVDRCVEDRKLANIFWIIAVSQERENVIPILLRPNDNCMCINFDVSADSNAKWVKCVPATEVGKIASQFCKSAISIDDGFISDAMQYVESSGSVDLNTTLVVVTGSLYLVRNYLQMVDGADKQKSPMTCGA